jgi:membrane protease YdiL (CAAX protease family)
VLLQISLLLIASLVSLVFLRRAVPLAFTNPCGFPDARWAWPEKVFTAGVVLFFLAMAAASAGRPEGRIDMGSLGASLVLYFALVLLVVGFLVFRNFNIREAFGLGARGWSWVLIAGWLLMFLPLVYFVQSLSYAISTPGQGPQAIVDFLLKSSGWQARAAVFGIAVFAAPVTEELIFRGCLYGILRKSSGRIPAIVISSILFALIHGHLPSLPGLLVLAAGLALIYERCGSLWAPITMHAAFNGITIISAILWPDLAK